MENVAELSPAPTPDNFYDAVGGAATFHAIVARFYELVADDEVLRPLYPEEDLTGAEDRLRMFLEQYWGDRVPIRTSVGIRGYGCVTHRFGSAPSNATHGCAVCGQPSIPSTETPWTTTIVPSYGATWRWPRSQWSTHRSKCRSRFEAGAAVVQNDQP